MFNIFKPKKITEMDVKEADAKYEYCFIQWLNSSSGYEAITTEFYMAEAAKNMNRVKKLRTKWVKYCKKRKIDSE